MRVIYKSVEYGEILVVNSDVSQVRKYYILKTQ